MTLTFRLLPIALVLVILMATACASAWHQEDERENAKYSAIGGDPRVLEDMGACREETRNESGVSCAVLYGHIHDILNPVQLNTQIPADCAPDLARGSDGAPHIEPLWSFTRRLLYNTAGFVIYPDQSTGVCDERPRTHWERSMGGDLHISDAASIRAYWYLSADTLEFSPLRVGTGTETPVPSAGAMPCLTVRVTLETGRFLGSGEVLTEGETTKTILSTPAGHGPTQIPLEDPCTGSEGTIRGEEVTEFAVELAPLSRTIPADEPFSIGVHWYQHNGTSGDPAEEDNIAHNDWNQRTGSEHRNRIVIPVERPIHVIDLQVLESRVDEAGDRETIVENLIHPNRIQVLLRSSWGPYDVDEENLRFHVVHEDGTKTPLQHLGPPRTTHYNDWSPPPRNLSFSFDPQSEGLGPGTYTLQVSAPNWQHTAQAQAQTVFVIEEEAETQTGLLPSPGIVPLLLLLGLLVGLARHPRPVRGCSR